MRTIPGNEYISEYDSDEICVLNNFLTRRIEEQTAELQSIQTRMQTLGQAVGHDLRGHLMNIGGYAELLRDYAGAQLDDKGRHYLQTILNSTEKLDEAVAGIVALGKAQEPARPGPIASANQQPVWTTIE